MEPLEIRLLRRELRETTEKSTRLCQQRSELPPASYTKAERLNRRWCEAAVYRDQLQQRLEELMENNMNWDLGDRIRDRISGFEGIAIGHTRWLNGCTRWLVAPEKLHENKPIEAQWFDTEQLQLVAKLEDFVTDDSHGGPPTAGDPRP